MMEQEIRDRRPIRARGSHWAAALSRWLQRQGATPNGISLASIVFAGLAADCFYLAFRFPSSVLTVVLLICAALFIQGRLLCNLLDGMVAVEGGLRSPVGAVYNDLPDRISDTLILLGVGYGLMTFPSGIVLGWAAALLALLTAYIRLLGGSCGLPQYFGGPMAKQHRMALLTAGSLLAVFLPAWWGQALLLGCLWVIVLGTLLTIARRTRHIMQSLRDREAVHEQEQ